MTHRPDNDAIAARWRKQWLLDDGVIYLNHGSFGPAPRSVLQVRQEWLERLERNPMDFYLRRFERQIDESLGVLGEFVGADGGDLIFVENATVAMNIVAANLELQPGDEVLLTDHEYGAVSRVWRETCRRAGARLVVRSLPQPLTDADAVVEALLAGSSAKTRLIVVSHVTSPTAVILPVEQICRRARERDIAVCVDGPHAPAMIDVNLRRIECDFYAASCHKWLSAPFGSGFLYAARRHQQNLRPAVTSWGRSLGGRPYSWKDEFTWSGTRDPSAYLAVPAAIEFLQSCGLESFRCSAHALAQYARQRITELTGMPALVPDSSAWYASMVTLPLPEYGKKPPEYGSPDPLATALWERHRIEVVINRWQDRRHIRVSCHLYTSAGEIDVLVKALGELLDEERPR